MPIVVGKVPVSWFRPKFMVLAPSTSNDTVNSALRAASKTEVQLEVATYVSCVNTLIESGTAPVN